MDTLAFSAPAPLEIIILLLVFALPIVVLSLAFRLSRAKSRSAFPVIPVVEPDGPGRYHVVGVDKTTRADRALTLDAASRANAQVKAELDGIVVTAVTKTS